MEIIQSRSNCPSMPTLCLVTPGTRVQLTGRRLRVELPPENAAVSPAHELMLADIERVVVSERCSLTMPALAELLRLEIPVVITSGGERVLGICLPPAPHSSARLAQYRRANDSSFAMAISILLIEAKILNSRRVLQRLSANRKDSDVAQTLRSLSGLASACTRTTSLDVLRGYEGTSAGQYFEAYARFFPADCPFERRSRRPPHNPPNAILSYAYTLLAAEAEATLHAAGLDPSIGFLHEGRRPACLPGTGSYRAFPRSCC